jgi:hypothetical protein
MTVERHCQIKCSASIGVASMSDQKVKIKSLVQSTDKAKYRAKSNIGNQVAVRSGVYDYIYINLNPWRQVRLNLEQLKLLNPWRWVSLSFKRLTR